MRLWDFPNVTGVALALLLFGCGSGGSPAEHIGKKSASSAVSPLVIPTATAEDIAASKPSHSQVRVTMHDFPLNDKEVSNVFVTIQEIRIGSDTKGWIILNDQPQEFDLLTLVNNAAAALGEARVEPGSYDQIRLVLSENNRVIANGQGFSLKIPSGQQTGIKLDGPFTVGGGEILNIELDFNAQQSVHWNKGQGFILKPVIKIVSVTSAGGLFGARQITAAQGGVVALPDGAMVQIPAGALPVDTEVTIEKIPDSSGGAIVSQVYSLGPEGLELVSPVVVSLPYDPIAIPPDSTETDLVLTNSFERIKGTLVDLAQHIATAPVPHFSPCSVETPKEKPKTLTSGILHYDHGSEKGTPYHVIVADLTDPSVYLKMLSAPESGGGKYTLESVTDMVIKETNQLAKVGAKATIPIAINGSIWVDDHLTTTTYVDGSEKLFCRSDKTVDSSDESGASCTAKEMKLSFSALNPADITMDQWNSKIEIPFQWGVIASTTTVVWNCEFGNKQGLYTDKEIAMIDPRLVEYVPRTAIGFDEQKKKLLMLVAGGDFTGGCCSGMRLREVYNVLRRFGAYKAILLDGGPSSTLVINGKNRSVLEGPSYSWFISDDGRDVINGVALVSKPTTSGGGTPGSGSATVLVDDLLPGSFTLGACGPTNPFCLLGPADFWKSRDGLGSGGHMWHTFANDEAHGVENSARWYPAIPAAGLYKVEAFIPSNCATTTCARYEVHHKNGINCTVVDQYNISTDKTGEYADLGVHYFEAGKTGYVELKDLTYELWKDSNSPVRQIGVDMIRFVPLSSGTATPSNTGCDETVFKTRCAKPVTRSLPCL